MEINRLLSTGKEVCSLVVVHLHRLRPRRTLIPGLRKPDVELVESQLVVGEDRVDIAGLHRIARIVYCQCGERGTALARFTDTSRSTSRDFFGTIHSCARRHKHYKWYLTSLLNGAGNNAI